MSFGTHTARPGFWVGHERAIELCDGRLFTQRQTDLLIEIQLWCHFGWNRGNEAHEEILGLGWPRYGLYAPEYLLEFPVELGYSYAPGQLPGMRPTTQRGGIHTRAAVRWLARAAWADRDVNWREPHVDEFSIRASLLEFK